MEGTALFDPTPIAADLERVRRAGRAMLDGALKPWSQDTSFYEADFAFFGFVERAQAFHIGACDLVERGNPLGALTLLRSSAENVATSFWIERHPEDLRKLMPGATERLPIGRLVAEAEKALPGFKRMYAAWSDAAHPSGAGAFHTLTVEEDRTFKWQSMPTFRTVDDARQVLVWIEQVCSLAAGTIRATVEARVRATSEQDAGRAPPTAAAPDPQRPPGL
ncbi:hypothetical protein [Curtobacterium sp. AB7]|uniref:hypothetical protein n=1 Tax=Curtobacterium sp. AB7 TaxID=3349327 RepID=UPI0038359E09